MCFTVGPGPVFCCLCEPEAAHYGTFAAWAFPTPRTISPLSARDVALLHHISPPWHPGYETRILATEQELSDFLKGVELRAFKRAAYHLRDDDAALDVVQDAMMKLARQYADRPVNEFPMLFQRILSTTMLDWFRRRKVQTALFSNASDIRTQDDTDFDVLEALITSQTAGQVESAETTVARQETLATIEQEIQGLPARQREAFLLRYWEEMDVAETAQVMGCSEGSVKTHCSRAVHALAKALNARGLRL